MSEADKKEFELNLRAAVHTQEIELLKLAQNSDAEFNQRIKEMEGTTSDLKTIPILGPIMLFLRGAQRPTLGIYDYLS